MHQGTKEFTAPSMGLIRLSQDCDLPLTLANFLKFYPHISLEEIHKRGNWSAFGQTGPQPYHF